MTEVMNGEHDMQVAANMHVNTNYSSISEANTSPSLTPLQAKPKVFPARTAFLIIFAMFQTCVGFQIGYVFCYTNQITPALNAKFNWTTKQEQTRMESIVGSSATLTIMFGAWISGYLIKSGRRRVMMAAAVIGIIGAAITVYQKFVTIIIGRLVYGFSCGMLAISMPRVMEETVPGEWVGLFGGCYCLSFAFAVLVAYFMAVFLPPESDTVALAESPVTQVIFAMPILFYAIQLLLQLTYLTEDSFKFCILNDKIEEAKIATTKIYRLDDCSVEDIIGDKKRTSQKQTSTCTAKDAYFTRYYRSGSYVALIVMIIHQLAGMNVILLYSNTIIAEMPNGFLTPREGTYVIGIWNFIASACSLYTAKHFKRRTLFIGGHFGMGVAHILVGVCILMVWSNLALGFMLVFMFMFQNSSGCITWLYCSEVAVDVALGIVGVAGYFTIFWLTLYTVPLMNSGLHQSGTFFLFGVISIIASVWCYFYLKETSGMSDKDKKSLYVPQDLREILTFQEAELLKGSCVISEVAQFESNSTMSNLKDLTYERDF